MINDLNKNKLVAAVYEASTKRTTVSLKANLFNGFYRWDGIESVASTYQRSTCANRPLNNQHVCTDTKSLSILLVHAEIS